MPTMPSCAIAAAVQHPRPAELLDRLRRLADRADALAAAMDFRPLYKPDRHLFAIGFNLARAGSTAPATTCWPRKPA